MSQKTEKATPKRRKEARERGNVLRSADVATAAVLLGVFAGLKILGGYTVEKAAEMMRYWVTRAPAMGDEPITVGLAAQMLTSGVLAIAAVAAPIMAVGLVVALAANLLQVGFLFTPKALRPRFNRISPSEGFKRIFSVRSLAEMLKAVLKIGALGWVGWGEYRNSLALFPDFSSLSVLQASATMADMALNIAFKMGLVLLVLAGADYFYQWWRRERELRMTKQEIKDEYKLTEGDPQTKSRIRQKQRQLGMMRMMQAVPTANVVITNPTHYAVALRYRDGRDAAPVVVAKGRDFVAQKIKEEARKHGVELVENRPLAQALYIYCDVGDSIPKDMYKAVAEVLAYVYRLRHPHRAGERAAAR
jgi:flagellar biosynthetic protein FlhB